jgi:deoxyribose-phosphate aldolase
MDLTTLNSTDSPKSVADFVRGGLQILDVNNLPEVAAVCVYPNFGSLVREVLASTSISTACVAAAFPHGQSDLPTKIVEVKNAVHHGADEIDIVINRGLILEGRFEEVENEIHELKNACGNAKLKTILEVCELDFHQVYIASQLAISGGSDFLKTSTGKGASGASLEKSAVMLKVIVEHYEKTGNRIGFKAAGGISTFETAMEYVTLVHDYLGEEWLSKSLFRIGASSLLTDVVKKLR